MLYGGIVVRSQEMLDPPDVIPMVQKMRAITFHRLIFGKLGEWSLIGIKRPIAIWALRRKGFVTLPGFQGAAGGSWSVGSPSKWRYIATARLM